MNPLGAMGGRLSLPENNRIQSFPKKTWRQEFARAAQCKLDCIEWIFDSDEWQLNPIASDSGIRELKSLIETTGVKIHSVCADYFMEQPLVRVSKEKRHEGIQMLKFLLEKSSQLGVEFIGLPFVDASAILTEEDMDHVIESLAACIPLAKKLKIQLLLETSLDPKAFLRLLQRINDPVVGVNYDIGNSASLGFDTTEEIEAYGSYIGTVHIKDRKLGGTTVPLGTGNADIGLSLRRLSEAKFTGPFILQAARGPEGEEVETIVKYLEFLRPYLQAFESNQKISALN